MQANRNGFFYVFDRTDGTPLLAKQFIKNLTWASGIGRRWKTIRNPNQEPTAEGTHVCPSQDGATNWFSPSYNPSTGLYYFQVFEKCSIYTKRPVEWEQGKAYGGGTQRVDTTPKPQRLLYALDLQTGTRKWELPQAGTGSSWGGTLATSTGLVFFGDDSGAFAAADAASGKPLWSFQANTNWHASPMAYQFDGQQYIAIAAGGDISRLDSSSDVKHLTGHAGLKAGTTHYERRFGRDSWCPARAIMTSVDLMIASASSPRRSFSARTASAVMTAVSDWSPTRRRTCASSPSIRTSSMNPCSRFLALKPSSDSSASEVSAAAPAFGLLAREQTANLVVRDAMVPAFSAGGPDPSGVDPSLQGRIRDAELLGRRSHGQERHSTPFWSKSLQIVSP